MAARLATQLLAPPAAPAAQNLAPAYGPVLMFAPDERQALVAITALDDPVPELLEEYALLLYAHDGATVAARVAPVSVDESDHPYGLFRWAVAQTPAAEPDGNITLQVVRDAGAFGAVSLTWGVQGCQATDPLQPARPPQGCAGPSSADVLPLGGALSFAPGQRSAGLTLTVLDDSVPELEEHILLRLEQASPVGALDADASDTVLSVAASDSPYGTFSLEALDGSRTAVVSEGTGNTLLRVRRAAGTFGTIDLQLALSPAATPDLRLPAPSVTFAPGSTQELVSVTIVDDDEPEPPETVGVSLVNASLGAQLDPAADTVALTVAGNDDFRGVLYVAPDSAAFVVSEADTVNITIVRARGRFGAVSVAWAIDGDPADLDSPATGVVAFADQQATAIIAVAVRADARPELAEALVLRLGIVAGGARLHASNPVAATITVRASNDPHGVFAFVNGSATLVLAEPAGTARVSLWHGRPRHRGLPHRGRVGRGQQGLCRPACRHHCVCGRPSHGQH